MFKSIKIENFRGIKKLEIDDFKQVNLFVGGNNSGKTSVLDALFMSLSPNNPILFNTTNGYRGLLDVEIISEDSASDNLQHSLEVLFYRLEQSQQIVISTELKEPQQCRNIIIERLLSDTVETRFSKTSTSVSTELKNYWKGLSFSFEVSGLNKKNKTKQKKFESRALLVKQKDARGNTFVGLQPEQDLDYVKSLGEASFEERKGKYVSDLIGTNLLSDKTYFDRIKLKRRKEELIELVKSLESNIRDIDVINQAFYVDLQGFDKLVRFEVLGAGTKKILSLVCNVMGDEDNLSNGSVLLIDEIENGLHYTAQEKLLKWLFEIAKEKNIQIFVTTHSMDCVKAFVEASEKVYGEKADEARLYRLVKKEEEIIVRKHDGEVLESWMESPWEIR